MAETALVTERLRLRTWDEADIDPFMEHLNTPAVTRYLTGVEPRESYEAAFERITRCQADHGHCFWIAERLSDGEMLGFCGLKIAQNDNCAFSGTPEIGWRLREDAWGQGYAREAATATLRYAFEDRGYEAVCASTVEANKASRGLMKRLGMTRRPDLDFADPLWADRLGDAIIYWMERERWQG